MALLHFKVSITRNSKRVQLLVEVLQKELKTA